MIELIQQIITKQTNDTNSSAILRIAKKSNEIRQKAYYTI